MRKGQVICPAIDLIENMITRPSNSPAYRCLAGVRSAGRRSSMTGCSATASTEFSINRDIANPGAR